MGPHVAPHARVEAMQALLARYTSDLPSRPASFLPVSSSDSSVVIVTGTTGSLGSHLLEALASASSVSRVYALNRPDRKGRSLRDRQTEALRERGLDESVLGLEKVKLVECDLTQEWWGVGERVFSEMHDTVTHVLHNAWRVDLVSPLSVFAPNIAGLRSLIDFCLTSPLATVPRLVFTSSLAVTSNALSNKPCPEDPIPPAWALGMGYTEAKWICEEILFAACRTTLLDALVVRVGQIAGGRTGAWATNEWFASMVQSAGKGNLGCLPADSRLLDWFPFDLACSALIDFLHAPSDVLARIAPTRCVHLVHPQPVPWNSVAVEVARMMGARLVPYDEWLDALQRAAAAQAKGAQIGASPRRMRAIGLLPFFRILRENVPIGPRAMGYPVWEGVRGVAASPTLSDPNVPRLGAEDVRRWIGYWHRVGFIRDEDVLGVERARL